MDAAVYRNGQFTLETCDDPFPAESEVRVRVIGSGVCDTDERLRSFGLFPEGAIPGHAIAGQIDAIGAAVRSFRKGDMVVVHFVAACGDCVRCRAREDNLCERGEIVGLQRPGGIAGYVCAPASCALPFPARIAPAEAALLPCGYGTPLRALRQGGVREGETVLLLGARLWALAAVQMCHAIGARAIVADDDEERLSHAEAVGADEIRRGRDLSGSPADVAIDFTGEPPWIEAALGSVRRGGRVVVVGRAGASGPVGVELARFVPSELSLGSAFLVRRADTEELVRWLVDGRIAPAALLSHRATLYELDDAFHALRELNPKSVVVDV